MEISVEEFRWDLKVLMREVYPQGLPLTDLSASYLRWQKKQIQPNSIILGCNSWEIVFRDNALLKETFIITADANPRIKIRDGNETEEDIKDILSMATYATIDFARTIPQQHSNGNLNGTGHTTNSTLMNPSAMVNGTRTDQPVTTPAALPSTNTPKKVRKTRQKLGSTNSTNSKAKRKIPDRSEASNSKKTRIDTTSNSSARNTEPVPLTTPTQSTSTSTATLTNHSNELDDNIVPSTENPIATDGADQHVSGSQVLSAESSPVALENEVFCDVCNYQGSKEGNKMITCFECRVSVHQICYGILNSDENWICRTCIEKINRPCILCPDRGGAMKPIDFGYEWAHLSCGLWIPELTVESVTKMEPIIGFGHMARWRLHKSCSLCKKQRGACIQCDEKDCKTYYHIRCAFKYGLKTKCVLGKHRQEFLFKSYCGIHSEQYRERRSVRQSGVEGQPLPSTNETVNRVQANHQQQGALVALEPEGQNMGEPLLQPRVPDLFYFSTRKRVRRSEVEGQPGQSPPSTNETVNPEQANHQQQRALQPEVLNRREPLLPRPPDLFYISARKRVRRSEVVGQPLPSTNETVNLEQANHQQQRALDPKVLNRREPLLIPRAPDLRSVPTYGLKYEMLLYPRFQNKIKFLDLYNSQFKITAARHVVEAGARKLSTLAYGTHGKIYDIGGTTNFDSVGDADTTSSNLTDIFKTKQGNVSEFSRLEMVDARKHFGACVCDNYLYVIGGYQGNAAISQAERLELNKNSGAAVQWESIRDMPHARAEHGVAVLENMIYVIGGVDQVVPGGEEFYCDSVLQYDTRFINWGFISPMNEARANVKTAVMNNRIYAVGGEIKEYGSQTFMHKNRRSLDTVEVYSTEWEAWTYCTKMNRSRSCGTIVVQDDLLYAIGGDSKSNPTMEVYDTRIEKWILLNWPTNLSKQADLASAIVLQTFMPPSSSS